MPRDTGSSPFAWARARPFSALLLFLMLTALYIGGTRLITPRGDASRDGALAVKEAFDGGIGEDADDEMFPSLSDLSEEEMDVLEDEMGSAEERLVHVELGVMSRCPDALYCESVMDKVLLSGRTRDKVNMTLSYIGKIDKDEPGGVKCLHGGMECDGNIQQLCVAAHATTSSALLSPEDLEGQTASGGAAGSPSLPPRFLPWQFLQTHNYLAPKRIGELAYAKEVAKAVGIDWEGSGVGRCVARKGERVGTGRGGEGERLLRKSVRRTMEMGVKKSCTILIEGEVRCIHDGEWYDCDDGHEVSDFVRSIDEAYKRLNPGRKSKHLDDLPVLEE